MTAVRAEKKTLVSVLCESALYALLKDQAGRNRRSLSSEAAWIIQEHFRMESEKPNRRPGKSPA